MIKIDLEESKRRGGLRSAIEEELRVCGSYYLGERRSNPEATKEFQLGWIVFNHIMFEKCMLAGPKYIIAWEQTSPINPDSSLCIVEQTK